MNLFEIFITQPIFNLLLVIYNFVGDFGIALILFTAIVKLLMWPITKSQLHQTKLMRKLQPELQKIRKESKGNRQLESLRMMDLYRKNNVKPFRSMLTLFIQIPIFLTLFSVVRIISTQQSEIPKFVYAPVSEFSKVKEIIEKPESFEPKLFNTIRLSETAVPVDSKSAAFLFVIALFSALTQWYSSKQTMGKSNGRKIRDIMREAAEGKEADQSEMNQIVSRQMSFMMPAMMFFAMINFYGAISFYYFVNNLLQIAQQWYIFNADKKELEEIADEEVSEVVSKKIKNAKPAQIVEKPKPSGNVRRIKAKDNRRKK